MSFERLLSTAAADDPVERVLEKLNQAVKGEPLGEIITAAVILAAEGYRHGDPNLTRAQALTELLKYVQTMVKVNTAAGTG